ncbi:MAG: T9SS type A sorting domain-containing protein, partial [Bacteroidota bacterium]
YRLTEHDLNGSETVFKAVTVKNCNDDKNFESQIYSSGSTIYFNIGSGKEGNCMINVFDASGRLVKKDTKMVQQGMNSFQLDCTEIAKGIYLVQCVNASEAITQKLWIK